MEIPIPIWGFGFDYFYYFAVMESAQQTPPERNVGEQRMAFQYPSSDVGLPRDWSY